MNDNEFHKFLEMNVAECQTKLELINDYLERFKITDARLRAPIFDVERCVGIITHLMHDYQVGSNDFKGE